MPKVAKELGALQVSRLTSPGLHFVGGVAGLGLQITTSGSKSWTLRVMVAGKRRDMGLGPYPEVTLAHARDRAREHREALRSGIDPIETRRLAQSAMRAAAAEALTFKQCAERYIRAHRASWSNPKHAQQWENTLDSYAYPVLGKLLVRDVAVSHVMQVVEPIWTEKNETASRVRGRIESVLDWAAARGLRSGENPARWRGHLDKLLPARARVAAIEHHRALPLADVGAFMARLRAADGVGAQALEFAILTAARSGEVRGAVWDEIDLEAKVWTVPAGRMKAGKEHRVPLSVAAVKLLQALSPGEPHDLLFRSRTGGELSDMTLSAVLRRMEVPAVPHGFRSTFRDWAAELTNYPRDVAEMALAHAIGDKVEAAYRRGDLFEKRRRMMEDWASFLGQPAQSVKVPRLAAVA